jgi:TonB family protein
VLKNDALGIPLLVSVTLHACLILLAPVVFPGSQMNLPVLFPVALVELSRHENPAEQRKVALPPEIKESLPPAPPKMDKPRERPSPAKAAAHEQEQPLPPAAVARDARENDLDAIPPVQPNTESLPSTVTNAHTDGGSEAGGGDPFGSGTIGIMAGAGSAGGGGGTAAYGPGGGAGAPGLTGRPPPRTNREAKPIQTVRAVYPPMALRAGLESDVTLRIEVDPEGKVTGAEIIKSGGGGFDEEALKAVKQSRFEPAQLGGRNIPAEFTYIYRFRLRR